MRKRIKHCERCQIVKAADTPGCHIFYDLASLPVLDPIFLIFQLHPSLPESQQYCSTSFLFQKKSLTDDLEQDEGFGTQSFRSSGQTDQETFRSSVPTDHQSCRSSRHVDMADGADDYQDEEDSTQLEEQDLIHEDDEYFDVSF